MRSSLAVLITCSLATLGVLAPTMALGAETTQTQSGPVEIRVDAAKGRIPISPYLFGRNNGVGDNVSPQFAQDVGLRIVRDSNGNNCTKINWKADLSSHPDWYNNVYPQHLFDRATTLTKEYGLQALYGLPVLGWIAKEGGQKYNFMKNDGLPPGTPIKEKGSDNLCADGKRDLYLQKTTPKESVDMLDHMFKPKPEGLGLDPKHFKYVHLDNEPECWASTHDDVGETVTAEQCIEKYVAVAKELKTRYPNVRILAPGFASEWFWWNWSDHKAPEGIPWMQFFVKRIAEESKKFGKPLIDVVDFHTYSGDLTTQSDELQEWRIFYDPDYKFPLANGCKRYPDGGWHDDQRVEMIFGRMEKWLDEYFGKGHGITLASTECNPGNHPATVTALWYASRLGTFADHGIEVYCPWEWKESFWEVMHIFSRLGRDTRVESVSGDPNIVSAYASINEKGNGMTIILVNREPKTERAAKVALADFTPSKGDHEVYALSNLPEGRTFKSAKDNALKKSMVKTEGDMFSIDLPPYSIIAVLLEGKAGK